MIDQILNQLADGLLDLAIDDLKAQMARLEQAEDFHLNLLNVSKDIAQGIDEQARAQDQTLENCTAELPSAVLATLARIGTLYALEGLKKGKGG